MRVRKWMMRMAILDLITLGLLFFARSYEQGDVTTMASAPGAIVEAGKDGIAMNEPGPQRREDSALRQEGGANAGTSDGAGGQRQDERKEVAASGGAGADQDVGKCIALTFDDGPHPIYTEKLLDGLAQRDVKATFFVTGANAEKYPEIIKRIQEEGHLIGNHTYHHVQLTAANGDQFREEIISTNEVIKEITGEDTEYIRPPYGSWNKKYEEELNMFPVLWSIDPRDWCSDDVDCIVRNTVDKIKEGDIILMHDQYKSSVTAALAIVDKLQEEGYEFVTVEEILLD